MRDVVDRGVAAGTFSVDDSADTTLALLSMVVDVARWYSPTIRRRRPRSARRTPPSRFDSWAPATERSTGHQGSLGAPGPGAELRAVRRRAPSALRHRVRVGRPGVRPRARHGSRPLPPPDLLTHGDVETVDRDRSRHRALRLRSRRVDDLPQRHRARAAPTRRRLPGPDHRTVRKRSRSPPYGGAFADVVPHLTLDAVSSDGSGTVSEESTRRAVAPWTPAACRATRLDLAWYEPHGCRVLRSWRLGGGPAAPA